MRLTDEQARGILELRLQRLTGLEREKIQAGDDGGRRRRSASCWRSSARSPRRMEVMRDELLKARGRDRVAAHDRHRRRASPTRTTRA